MGSASNDHLGISPSTEDWNDLVDAILKNDCVLFLGPHFAKIPIGGKSISIYAALSHFLADKFVELGGELVTILDPGNLYHVAQLLFRRLGETEYLIFAHKYFSDFFSAYEKDFPDVYRQLVSIPFSTIVATSPDNLLRAAYLKYGRCWEKTHFWYFNYLDAAHNSNTSAAVADQADEFMNCERLLVNLFGYIEDPLSLVFTERQKLNYIDILLRKELKSSVPWEIAINLVCSRDRIGKLKKLVFLGFDSTDWQFRALLLWIHGFKNDFQSVMGTMGGDILNRHSLKSNLRVHFNDLPAGQFLEELKHRMPKENSQPCKIFVMHSLGDSEDFGSLRRSLLQRRNVEVFSSDLTEGVLTEINDGLGAADIVICLVSFEFLALLRDSNNDSAISGVERAVRLNMQRQKKLILVYVSSCLWEENDLLCCVSPDSVFPRGGRPVHDESRRLDDTWKEVSMDVLRNSTM